MAIGVTSVVPWPKPARMVCVGFHCISLSSVTISLVQLCVMLYPSGMPSSSLSIFRISGPLPSRPLPSCSIISFSAHFLIACSSISMLRRVTYSRRRSRMRLYISMGRLVFCPVMFSSPLLSVSSLSKSTFCPPPTPAVSPVSSMFVLVSSPNLPIHLFSVSIPMRFAISQK